MSYFVNTCPVKLDRCNDCLMRGQANLGSYRKDPSLGKGNCRSMQEPGDGGQIAFPNLVHAGEGGLQILFG